MIADTPYFGQPILQLLAYKRLIGEHGERYRLLLSDGQYLHSFCVLSVYLNHLINEGKLTEQTIFKVVRHQTPLVYKFGCDDRFVEQIELFRIFVDKIILVY